MKGYAKREPGRYSYGAGLWLHIGKTGLSKWKFRSRSNDTDTTIDLGTANSHNNERWARSQIKLVEDGQQIGSGILGPAIMDWANSKLKTKRWSDRHYLKTTERIKKHCGDLFEVKIDDLTRPMIVSHLETIDDIDSAGRVYSWIKECLRSFSRSRHPFLLCSWSKTRNAHPTEVCKESAKILQGGLHPSCRAAACNQAI